MPMYQYHCATCDVRRDVMKKLAEIDSVTSCTKCGFAMNRELCAPMVRPDIPGYTCPITDKWIEGRRAHAENLKRHGCRVLESGETEACKRNAAASEAAFDSAIEATVEEFVETLPTEKKEQLAVELQSGLDVNIVRQSAA